MAEAALRNPEVRAARAAARGGHEALPLARSAWMPTVELYSGVNLTRISDYPAVGGFRAVTIDDSTILIPYTVNTIRDIEERTLGLALRQRVYHGGSHWARLRQAEEQVLQGGADVERTEQRVLLSVATAYLDVLRAERAVQLHEASVAAFEERRRETETQFRIGDRTQADMAQADAELAVAEADLATAKADLRTQRALFLSVAGVPADGLEPVGEPGGLPEALETARRAAVDAAPAVRAAAHAERAAGHEVRAAAGQIGLRVDLQGGIVRTAGTGRGSPDSTDASLGVRLTVPLYQAGAAGARLRQARQLRSRRQDELLVARRAAMQRATRAWNDLAAARERRTALTAAAEASRVALAGIRREARIGERTTREVLDAERILISRRVRVLSAERDAVVGAYGLLGAVGALTARRLGVRGVPDLADEAREARGDLRPGLLFLE